MVVEVRERLSLGRGGELGTDSKEFSQVLTMCCVLLLVVMARCVQLSQMSQSSKSTIGMCTFYLVQTTHTIVTHIGNQVM